MSDQFELCSLWIKEDKNGKPYASGQLPDTGLSLKMTGQWINIFPVEKKSDKSPDRRVVISKRVEQKPKYTKDQEDQMMQAHHDQQNGDAMPF